MITNCDNIFFRSCGILAEELGDALQVRSLAAAGAGAAELEQGLCKLAVLDVGELVDEVVLVTKR